MEEMDDTEVNERLARAQAEILDPIVVDAHYVVGRLPNGDWRSIPTLVSTAYWLDEQQRHELAEGIGDAIFRVLNGGHEPPAERNTMYKSATLLRKGESDA